MGYSYVEADALIYRIRPTLRPPVENGNRTQNPGKRTSTRGAGAQRSPVPFVDVCGRRRCVIKEFLLCVGGGRFDLPH